MLLSNIKTYIRESIKLNRLYPNSFDIWQLIKFFPKWYSCLDKNKNPLSDQRPWITFAAIEYLDKYLTQGMKVFEYGSGGSTIFLTKRVEEVISIEHEKDWHIKVLEELKKYGINNCQSYLVEPVAENFLYKKNPSDPLSYISSSSSVMSFKDYVLTINNYPDEYFDLILIDGRARPSCLLHSLPKIKKTGLILLDNSDREHYLKETSFFLKDLKTVDFPGPSPYVDFFTKTSIWQKKPTIIL